MGFSVQLHEILNRLPQSRQTMLFSATLPKTLVDFAKAGLQEPTLVRLDADSKISTDLEMAFFPVKQVDKEAALLYLLHELIKLPVNLNPLVTEDITSKKNKNFKGNKNSSKTGHHQTIIFVSTKHHVEYVSSLLKLFGYQISYIYGSLDQTARKNHINNFRTGQTDILVVTDIAARGIDIPIIEYVINYDFVDSSKIFVHRVGRTARAGKRGWAYSLITPEEVNLQLFLGRRLLIGSNETITPDYTSDITFGSFPPNSFDLYKEWVKGKLGGSNDLQSMYEVAKNGFKLFCKSRTSAAPESYKRAKEIIDQENYHDVHPLFENQIDVGERNRLNFINTISNFRPQETIFEVGSRGNKKASLASNIMKQRRESVTKIIDAHRFSKNSTIDTGFTNNSSIINSDESKSIDGSKKRKIDNNTKKSKKQKKDHFRDEQYFISHYQKDANTEKGYAVTKGMSFAEESSRVVMNTQDDELININRKKGLRWDNGKKNFVRGDGIGSDNKKYIKTESGAKIPATYKNELPSQKLNRRRFKHNKIMKPKPLDPFAINYEKKKRKFLKKSENGGDVNDISLKSQQHNSK
ncbi:2608_t:CDS:10 [Diversispora eburnea]|uniref:RNA helicase n=1 Tax=Diversispora eburnea TaxID=1213867 RepID=A0A9N9A5T0_9GLOM|nr:2608_t:CDS:10 [Diversispora eburnea]